MKIAVEELKLKFRYEPDTGHIYWIEAGKGKIKKKPAGTKTNTGYMMIMIDKKRYYSHRLAWALHHGRWPNDQVDHINGNKIDNRIINLREATNAENGKNYGFNKSNTSGIKGVSWCKCTNKWRAMIKVNNTKKCLGRYDTVEQAAYVRKQAEDRYFGEWGRK
jgi:hypothetical protein